MKRLTDKDFVYVHSGSTDIRKTFERARKELEAEALKQKAEAAARLKNVIQRRFSK